MPLQKKNYVAKDFALGEQDTSQSWTLAPSKSRHSTKDIVIGEQDTSQPLTLAPSQDKDETKEDIALGEQHAEESVPSTFASGLVKTTPLTKEEKNNMKDMFAVEIENGEHLHMKTV